MLNDLTYELGDIDINFEKNEKVSHLNVLLRDLGKSSVARSSIRCVTMETEPIYAGEIQLKTNSGLEDRDNDGDGGQRRGAAGTGDKPPVIISFDILPDGRQILIDQANETLKLYDQNNFFMYVSSAKPNCVAVLSNTEAVVSTCTNTLLKVTIGDSLAITKTKSKYVIGPINRCGEDIIAILVINITAHVSVLDKDFTIKKTIMKDDNKALFRHPVCLKASDDRSMLFVADAVNGCFGFTMDGRIQFHYQIQEASKYYGFSSW